MPKFLVPDFREDQDIVRTLKTYSDDLKRNIYFSKAEKSELGKKKLELCAKMNELVDLMNDIADIEMKYYDNINWDDARFILG